MARTGAWCAIFSKGTWLCAGFQISSVPSSPAVARRRPAGDQASARNVAETITQKALALARQIGVYELIYRLLTSQGWLAEKREAYDEADRYYQEALSLVRQHEKPRSFCLILFHIGRLRLKQRQTEKARAILQEALAQIPEGDLDLVDRIQNSLAQVISSANDR